MNYNLVESRENKINKLRKNESGVTLILITLILVISSVLALALITYYQTAALTSEVEAYRMQALYLAEAGVNRMIHSLNTNTTLPTSMNFTFYHNQTGSYSGHFDVTWNPVNRTINSTGTAPTGRDRQAIRTLIVVINPIMAITSWREESKAR
ncbi:MAG: hypothetical protein DDT41_01490 [candidate division WS2 bacterium]|nr:hypothetical protein [Candidatus Psychracetigena formicireducens]